MARGRLRSSRKGATPQQLKAQLSNAEINRQLREMGLVRVDVNGDGNCLYHAIAKQCEHDMRELRRICASELREHEFTYRFVADETNTENLDLFAQALRERGIYV